MEVGDLFVIVIWVLVEGEEISIGIDVMWGVLRLRWRRRVYSIPSESYVDLLPSFMPSADL